MPARVPRADHITVLDDSLAQLPVDSELVEVIVRIRVVRSGA
jgi:hypothetical protein